MDLEFRGFFTSLGLGEGGGPVGARVGRLEGEVAVGGEGGVAVLSPGEGGAERRM